MIEIFKKDWCFMRELYCKKCGKKINTKLWMVPNSCVCGVNLDEWQKDSGRTTFRYLLCLFLLMLPLFWLIYLLRILLKNLIILYTLILLISMIWLRQADGLLIRIGIVKMKNIIVK